MTCGVRERARRLNLDKYDWWLRVEPAFIALMVGRFLNDGRGGAPPSVESVLRYLRILARVKQYRRLEAVTALIDMVDRAGRKHADSVRDEED